MGLDFVHWELIVLLMMHLSSEKRERQDIFDKMLWKNVKHNNEYQDKSFIINPVIFYNNRNSQSWIHGDFKPISLWFEQISQALFPAT